MTKHLEGGCLCGSVRYVLTAPPHYVYFCHCRDCHLFTSRTQPWLDLHDDRTRYEHDC